MFKQFKHLLPNSKAFNLTPAKNLRYFFEGIGNALNAPRIFLDLIWDDIFPSKTRQLNEWETQFALPSTFLTEDQRRTRLDAVWKAIGGQSPRYIQDTLQNAGFNVYVHEWWDPIPQRPLGGSVRNDYTPTPRNPILYLDDGQTTSPFLMFDGGSDAQDGDTLSYDGATNVPVGYPLVNKVIAPAISTICDGNADMQDGAQLAQDGGNYTFYAQRQYILPTDSEKWHYFLYIGGKTFPTQAQIPNARREEFEELCLKIRPLEQWLGILVEYT